MSAWVVAGALEQLRVQLDTIAPRRSRASDGSIGDAAHASRSSDHNPWLIIAGQAYVTARDFTHDPAGGLDCNRLAAALARGRDQRVKYVIWNRRIMAGADGPQPWTWRPYGGSNPHTHHLHLSVVADLRGTVRIPWTVPELGAASSPAPRPPAATPLEDDMPLSLDDLAKIRDIVWQAPLPDHVKGRGTSLPAFEALAWANAHAHGARYGTEGVVRAVLGEALRTVPAELDVVELDVPAVTVELTTRLDEMARLLRGIATTGVDPQTLASAVAVELAARLREP